MTEQSPVIKNNLSVQLGALFGVLMVLEFVIFYVMDINPLDNPAIGTIMNTCNYLILPVIFISMACNSLKTAQSGYISFGQSLKTGVLVCVLAGVIYALFSVIFNLIFPEFTDEILRKTRDVIVHKNPDMTQEQLAMALSWTKKFMKPQIAIPVTIVMFAFIGLIYSLIIGAIVKKDPPQIY